MEQNLGNTPVKYDKENTKNPIARLLYNRFKDTIYQSIAEHEISTILDLGCGDGAILNYIFKRFPYELTGADIDKEQIINAKIINPEIEFVPCDGKNTFFDNNQFDMTLVLEVLEHEKDFIELIQEAKRVSYKYCIFSVPNEPLWRLLNILRGAHLINWGNTPGHINHWSKDDFVNLLSEYFEVIAVYSPIPWTIVKCRK